MFSQSLGLRSQKDGGPLGRLEGAESQTACLPRAIQGLKLDLELENFGLGVGGQAGEMTGTLGLRLWAKPWLGRGKRQPGHPAAGRGQAGTGRRGPLCGPQGPPPGLWSLPPIVRQIRCEAAWLPSEATEPVACIR